MMKNLPIGTQSFEELRNNNCVYVDKTEIIHRIISTGRVYFLSRPRRFGKSLLISTLEALFKGRKELFEGLYIYDKRDWTQQYPVIWIDWTRINHSTLEEMENRLCRYLRNIAKGYQITLEEETAANCFDELIYALYETTGKKVVILIDEYDKPITSHLFDSHMETIQIAVHDFYQVMKGCDKYIHFIFITGVSKFAGLSVFSALNHPDDITMNWDFVTICGYTQEEMEYYFNDYIDDLAKCRNTSRSELLDEIRTWYNGYSWDGKTSVYNPFSTLSLFRNKKFGNYWFRTATPSFLIEMLKKRNQIKPILQPIETGSSVFDIYEPNKVSEVPLLFQTGYLTIKNVISIGIQDKYTLDIPNEEVRTSFTECLLNAYSNYPIDDIQKLISDMQKQIHNRDASALEQNMQMLLANIPNILHIEREAYYHSMFLLMMKMLGFDIRGEVLTNIGRIDAVWKPQDGLIIVAEIKYHPETDVADLLDDAMKQIRNKKYYEAYLDHKVTLMAVAFSGKKDVKCKLEGIEEELIINN